jgi:hypothetical protein
MAKNNPLAALSGQNDCGQINFADTLPPVKMAPTEGKRRFPKDKI